MNATATKSLCEICNTRPVPSLKVRDDAGMSRDMKYCVPCFEEANWENTHSDGSHEGFEELTVRKSSFRTKAELEAWKVEKREETKNCWICHPELNEAAKEYTPRVGTSRAGMVINVSIRATGLEKAEEVIAKLPNPESYEAKITKPTKANGFVTKLVFSSTVQTFGLMWDQQGRFIGGIVSEGASQRKIRNVSEALRLSA